MHIGNRLLLLSMLTDTANCGSLVLTIAKITLQYKGNKPIKTPRTMRY